MDSVSIHASSREDATSLPRAASVPQAVSIHASSREDATRFFLLPVPLTGFNPRVLAGGRDIAPASNNPSMISFNPRVLAGGRDLYAYIPFRPHTVSIHASSREDATRAAYAAIGDLPLFQSTRPRGRTRHFSCRDVLLWEVSIHASSREDATHQCIHDSSSLSFNPRVLAGGRDSHPDSSKPHSQVSIHASSREDATAVSYSYPDSSSFNPRVLAGGRDEVKIQDYAQGWFQSTRPRGRTRPTTGATKIFGALFQSTRPRGRTRHVITRWFPVILCFNPRVLAGGRDPECFEMDWTIHVSIHASSREDATIVLCKQGKNNGFNPRVLAGGRDQTSKV